MEDVGWMKRRVGLQRRDGSVGAGVKNAVGEEGAGAGRKKEVG